MHLYCVQSDLEVQQYVAAAFLRLSHDWCMANHIHSDVKHQQSTTNHCFAAGHMLQLGA